MPRMGQAAAALESAADMIQGMLKPICTLLGYAYGKWKGFIRAVPVPYCTCTVSVTVCASAREVHVSTVVQRACETS